MSAKEEAKLKCFYGHADSQWLRLAPIKVIVLNESLNDQLFFF